MEEGERCRFNPKGVGNSIEDFAAVLDPPAQYHCTASKITVYNTTITRVFHSDKYEINTTGLKLKEVVEFLKHINNENSYYAGEVTAAKIFFDSLRKSNSLKSNNSKSPTSKTIAQRFYQTASHECYPPIRIIIHRH